MAGKRSEPAVAEIFLRWPLSLRDKDGKPQHWDTSTIDNLEDIKGEPGKVTCYFTVTPDRSNHLGNLHGGVIATLTDTIGSAAICTYTLNSHVSLSINIDYLNPGLAGHRIRVEAEVLKPGKTVATVVVKFFDDASDRLLAQGSHVKYIQPNTKIDVIGTLLEEEQARRATAKAKL